MMNKLTISLAGAGLALAACEAPSTLNAGFGDSVYHNMSMHIVDPTPADPDMAPPALMGTRAFGVIDRYEKGQVILPERLSTTK